MPECTLAWILRNGDFQFMCKSLCALSGAEREKTKS